MARKKKVTGAGSVSRNLELPREAREALARANDLPVGKVKVDDANAEIIEIADPYAEADISAVADKIDESEKNIEIADDEATLESEMDSDESEESEDNIQSEKDNLILGRFKTADELEATFKTTEAALTQSNQDKADQKRFYEDLLNHIPEKKEEEVKVDPDMLDKIADKLYENPKEAIAELTEAITTKVTQNARANSEKAKASNEANDYKSAIRYTLDRVGNPEDKVAIEIVKPENAVYIDAKAKEALRTGQANNWKDAYSFGVNEVKKFKDGMRGEVESSVSKDKDNVVDMKLRARAVKSSSSTSQVKTYSRAEIRDMRIKDPDKYRRMHSKLIKAYAEGRVR